MLKNVSVENCKFLRFFFTDFYIFRNIFDISLHFHSNTPKTWNFIKCKNVYDNVEKNVNSCKKILNMSENLH